MTTGTVTVVCGPFRNSLNVVGQSVGDVRERFGTELNIPRGATAQINGEDVSDDEILASSDELVFSKTSAEKGA